MNTVTVTVVNNNAIPPTQTFKYRNVVDVEVTTGQQDDVTLVMLFAGKNIAEKFVHRQNVTNISIEKEI